ncbi:MAG: metallophosphoesterase family protein [Pseudomonadota bacterium]|nr:metallophosphoesterase family protein [Pseudomonadota bacterium]
MKLHILSDLHRDLAGEIVIPAANADVVILAGDVDCGFDSLRWAMHTFNQPTLFVLGNHEIAAGNEKKLARFREMAEGSKVTILENDVWEQTGVRFLGCTLWAPANQRMRTAMRQSIAWLREMLAQPYTGTTVVITHYSPLHQSLPPERLIDDALAKRLSVDLRSLIEPSNIALWVHGHIHKTQDYFCGKTRIVCNPRGNSTRVEPRFDPEYVIHV